MVDEQIEGMEEQAKKEIVAKGGNPDSPVELLRLYLIWNTCACDDAVDTMSQMDQGDTDEEQCRRAYTLTVCVTMALAMATKSAEVLMGITPPLEPDIKDMH